MAKTVGSKVELGLMLQACTDTPRKHTSMHAHTHTYTHTHTHTSQSCVPFALARCLPKTVPDVLHLLFGVSSLLKWCMTTAVSTWSAGFSFKLKVAMYYTLVSLTCVTYILYSVACYNIVTLATYLYQTKGDFRLTIDDVKQLPSLHHGPK